MSEIIERLNVIIDGDHERGCEGRTYSCSCGFDDRLLAATREAREVLTRQREEIAALVEALANACAAADMVLAPICADVGRYLYDWADCPNMIEKAHDYGVTVSAKAFRDLYDATHPDILAQHKERNSAG